MQATATHRSMSNPLDNERLSHRLLDFKNKTGSVWSLDGWAPRPRGGDVYTVREFTVPPHRRLVEEVMSAEILRDAAALCALVLFGTMLALLLGGSGVIV